MCWSLIGLSAVTFLCICISSWQKYELITIISCTENTPLEMVMMMMVVVVMDLC